MTEQELADVLRSLPLVDPPEVSVIRKGHRLIATVVSLAFENMYEFERQRLVWHHLHEKFQLHELRPIEMVLTDSPSERARLATASFHS